MKAWQRLEHDLAVLLDGRPVPGSGSSYSKGDVESDLFLVEAKYRSSSDEEGPYIDLPTDWVETIVHHAAFRIKHPMLALEWGDGTRAFLIKRLSYETVFETAAVATPVLQFDQRSNIIRPSMIPCVIVFDINLPDRAWYLLSWEDVRFDLKDLVRRRPHRPRWRRHPFRKTPVSHD